MNAHIDVIHAEIKKRAAKFCQDNPRTCRGRETEIETTMLIGASIVFETEEISEEPIDPTADKLLLGLFDCPCGEHH